MDNIKRIREKETDYHELLYENNDLFSNSSWLHKPVKSVFESFDLLYEKDDLTILDLGCGVGRNSIPIAQKLIGSNSKVICIDMLDIAIRKLNDNAKKYEVDKYIEAVKSTVEDFDIAKNQYDFVVAVSVLEHLESISSLKNKLSHIAKSTKPGGVNCLILNTSVTETLCETGDELTPQFELNLETNRMFELLDSTYKHWRIIKKNNIVQRYEISRDSESVTLNTNVITYVVMKEDDTYDS